MTIRTGANHPDQPHPTPPDRDDGRTPSETTATPAEATRPVEATRPLPATGATGVTGATAVIDTGTAEQAEAERVGPSSSQVVGSAAAAVSAALVASRLGVAGTLIGAAVASVVSTVCAAYYTNFAKKTHAQVRRLGTWPPHSAEAAPDPTATTAAAPAISGAPTTRLATAAGTGKPRIPRLRRWWVGALAAFVLAVAGITALELGLGHPVSANEDSGTSVGRVVNPGPAQDAPSTPAPTHSPGATQSGSPTTAPTEAPTTTGPTESPSASPSGQPSSPSAPAGEPSAPATAPTQVPPPVTAPAAPPRSN